MSAMPPSSNAVRLPGAQLFWLVAMAETAGFATILTVIWLDELLDVPHWLFGAPASPVRIMEGAMESLGVVLLAALVIMFTRRLTRRVEHLESYITICAWCRRVHRHGNWYDIEAYFAQHQARTSHGICPDCAVRAEGDPANRP